MKRSEESMTPMTFYGFPHHDNRSFAIASGWRFTGSLIMCTYSSLALIMTFYRTVVILNGDKNVLWEKRESGTVTQSEESITWMTFYGFPHHGNRSFAVASGWCLTGSLIMCTYSSLALIMTFYRMWSFWTGVRMFCGRNGKWNGDTEWRIYDSDNILRLSSPRQ